MSLVERAMKAICREEGWPIAAADDDDYPPAFLQRYHKLAYTALTEIRNPTPAMIAAGAKKVRGGSASDCAAACWRAMHDAMMREEATE